MDATENLIPRPRKGTLPVTSVTAETLPAFLKKQSARLRKWVEGVGFTGAPNTWCLVPGRQQGVERVLVGIDPEAGPWTYAFLPSALPGGSYQLDPEPEPTRANQAALGWALAGYAFDRYKKVESKDVKLVWPKEADRALVKRTASAIFLVRDLVNTPAEDLGPAQLADAAQALGRAHGAKVVVIKGDALLQKNYPLIHAVGRASTSEPRLIDLRWDGSGHRKAGTAEPKRITLVGKGVIFDSGGLDLKPAAGMKLMKKDMGGSAHVLGLAGMIMDAGLPVRLRVLVPAVENAVAGNAFRPMDIIRSRKGLTVEIGNTSTPRADSFSATPSPMPSRK
ncbi:MAG: hypothetical protein R3E12_19250 [Candidatus Eisenbacteria bacterium]